MSTVLSLDSNRVSALEPTEGDERESFMLSPFAVPREMSVDVTAKGVTVVRFKYSGGIVADSPEPLDDLANPRVTLVIGKPHQKVVAIRFDTPVGQAELSALADRLERRAETVSNTAQRLSYKMTAEVVRAWLVTFAEKVLPVLMEKIERAETAKSTTSPRPAPK